MKDDERIKEEQAKEQTMTNVDEEKFVRDFNLEYAEIEDEAHLVKEAPRQDMQYIAL